MDDLELDMSAEDWRKLRSAFEAEIRWAVTTGFAVGALIGGGFMFWLGGH